jgi:hydrogenase maturation protein HypF
VRLRLAIRGAVQGVGFRPFVYRLATQLGLAGWVNNSSQGVLIEVEGGREQVEEFLLRIESERPPLASLQSIEPTFLDVVGYRTFEIRASSDSGEPTALVLPDIATCADCVREILDPRDRRHRYPFANCTNCGPRFSIIESLPYDRANTTMRRFEMCPACRAEYEDPRNRRFHAQPNACPRCGPHLELWNQHGKTLASHDEALLAATDAIRAGAIVAIKGLGGFHLLTDARSNDAVGRLRQLKRREEKPLAILCPSLEAVEECCVVSDLERRLLRSPEAPIVLVRRRTEAVVSNAVAPGNPYLGVMLPYTPLHHLLMAELGFPVVATSGNLSDEPICTDEREALERLAGIADLFLVHDRPIARPVDDSVVRVVLGRELVLRRARGYAPWPVPFHRPLPPLLAVGGHLKNTVAVSAGGNIFLSQHIGDLETTQALAAFQRVIADFGNLYGVQPSAVACDLHPDYHSTRFAKNLSAQVPQLSGTKALGLTMSAWRETPMFAADLINTPLQRGDQRAGSGENRFNGFRGGGKTVETVLASAPSEFTPLKRGVNENLRKTVECGIVRSGTPALISVQHHVAHVLACMAENELDGPVFGVSWDGTGYGPDGTVWGGEFLRVERTSWQRLAHFRTFPLPGGETAVREPRRAALGLLHALYGDAALEMGALPTLRAFSGNELGVLRSMLNRKLNSPLTSSVGRLFDAVASLVGLRQRTRFEGQAAMELEFAVERFETDARYEFEITGEIVDWAPMIRAIVADVKAGLVPGEIAARFHNTLAEIIVTVARRVGEPRVALSGGCFQNRCLTERAVLRLREAGFRPYWHQRVPPNDGGIALGQAVAASFATAGE